MELDTTTLTPAAGCSKFKPNDCGRSLKESILLNRQCAMHTVLSHQSTQMQYNKKKENFSETSYRLGQSNNNSHLTCQSSKNLLIKNIHLLITDMGMIKKYLDHIQNIYFQNVKILEGMIKNYLNRNIDHDNDFHLNERIEILMACKSSRNQPT